jgi:flagellar basal-body rod protein FlgG
MIRALWTAGTGMNAQQTNIDTIANNLANVNTTGYKKIRPEFEDLIYQKLRNPGSPTGQGTSLPTGLQVGHGTKLAATTKVFSQGDYLQTDSPLDMLIEGNGFFQIQMPDGTAAYTRNGAFKADMEGRLVTSEGYLVQPEITVPAGATGLDVAADGTVSAVLSGEENSTTLGQLQLAMFRNPAGLDNIGKGLYKMGGAAGNPTIVAPGTEGAGSLMNHCLEMSNVKVVEEMLNMIVAQRAYDVNAKAIQASDEMLQTANNLRR